MEARGPAREEPGFGTLLRRHRLAAGLSQEALAERARVSVEGISALERGFRRTPQRETIELLAGALALNDDQRRTFEAAATGTPAPRRRGPSVTIGPWPSAGTTNLPFAPTTFVGRDGELAALSAAFSQSAAVAVHGLGGVGKSSLAREYAVRNRDHYSVISWLDAETEDGIIEGLLSLGAMFVSGLAQIPNRRAAAQQVVDSVLRGFDKPVLLVFDNLEEERHLRSWLPRTGARALITSRNSAWGSDISATPLLPWPIETGVGYLQRESRRADLDEADARAIVEALGALPLALAHAAASLRGMRMLTPGKYREHVGAHLSKAPHGVEYPQSVFATFKAAISQAEQEVEGAGAALCFAASFAPEAIPDELFRQPIENYADGLQPLALDGATLDLRSLVNDEVRLDEALGALDRLSLLVFSEESRTYRIHRLVQLATKDLVAPAALAWQECAVRVVEAAFPAPEFATWPQCARLLPHVRVALDMLRGDAASLPAARLAHRSGIYLRERGQYDEARALQIRALAIQEKTLDANHPDVAGTLSQLALVSFDQGRRYGEVEALQTRAIEILEKSLGLDHPQVATILDNLALVCVDRERFDEAERLLQRSLSIREKALGSENPSVARTLTNLVRICGAQGRYDEAERLSARCIAILEKSVGAEHPDLAKALGNRGAAVRGLARYDEAVSLCIRAVAMHEKAYGPNHPLIAPPVITIAKVYRAQGRCEEAEAFFLRALAIREKSLAPDNPYIACSLCHVADLYHEQGRRADARPLYERALTILEKTVGPDHSLAKEVREKLKEP